MVLLLLLLSRSNSEVGGAVVSGGAIAIVADVAIAIVADVAAN